MKYPLNGGQTLEELVDFVFASKNVNDIIVSLNNL